MKKPILLLTCLLAGISLFSQTTSNIQQPLSVNGDGAAPVASAQLDVSAIDKGILVPRLTTAQRTGIVMPAPGLLVYDSTLAGFWFYNGTAWQSIGSGMTGTPSMIADADGNTKVQTEKNPNEDIIRFDLAGTESMVLRKNAGGSPRLEMPNALNNTFLGANAGSANTTGNLNTATGSGALSSNSTGGANTATGRNALVLNTTGSNNTAIGTSALFSNATGSSNTATGQAALIGTTGSFNTANGAGTLFNNKANSRSTAIGFQSMYYADDRTTGRETYNTALGYEALKGSATAANNVGRFNTAVGDQALYAITSGERNTAIGMSALFTNTTGYDNTATGFASLLVNTTGFWNTANGAYSLNHNIGGIGNTAMGESTLDFNTNGSYNTANGQAALYLNTTGYSNVAMGKEALYSNTVRSNLVAVGDSALYNNGVGAVGSLQAKFNTAYGSKALFSNTIGFNNTASGYQALFSNTTGEGNTANGVEALKTNTTGVHNTANGYRALYANTDGVSNAAHGWYALNANTSGSSNTATGLGALQYNTTGSHNSATGKNALWGNTTGYSNVAMGRDALFSNTDRSNLVAVGDSALYNNGVGASQHFHATFNTALGSKALFANTTGNGNTATGERALFANTSGALNTANGKTALYFNTTGDFNTATGFGALILNTGGSLNSAIGFESLRSNTTGGSNTANGAYSLYSNTTGSNNTALGYFADVSSGGLTNATAIGYNAKVGASNSLVLGGTGGNAVNVGIGKTAPEVRLHAFAADPSATNGIVGYFQRAGAGDVGISFSQEGVIAYGITHPVGGGLEFHRDRWPGGAGTLQMKITDSGNVGIGTATPSATLDVRSATPSILVSNAGGTEGALYFGNPAHGVKRNYLNPNDMTLFTTAGDVMLLSEGGPDAFMILGNNGKVGIGLMAGTNKLEVAGTASKWTAGDWLANSDARLKKNIAPLDSRLMLDKLLALQGVTYEWDDDKTGSKRPEGIQYGFVAQNIQTVFPTLVEEDKLGFLQTAYGTYDAMTVEAIRALHEEIGNLKLENAAQESLLRNLGAEIERLKKIEAQLDKITAALQGAGIAVEK